MTSLVWEGCLNVRDLGGLPTADGGTTQLGAIVRSDNVNVLTAEGWRALADHGVVRIVDLRWTEELEGEGPPSADVEIVHVSLLGEAFDEEYVAELDASLDAVSDVAEHYAWSYVDFLERFRDRFGLAVAAVADASGPVVVHCMGGKDRTGLISALVLRVAGVEPDVIASDYAQSEANLAPRGPAWLEDAANDVERERRRKLLQTPAAAMLRVLEALDERYGGVPEYLRGAGVTDDQLARLRARLVAA